MYILIALASLVLEACMESIDKIAIVKDKAIDLFGVLTACKIVIKSAQYGIYSYAFKEGRSETGKKSQ